jgi:hypothetical protein
MSSNGCTCRVPPGQLRSRPLLGSPTAPVSRSCSAVTEEEAEVVGTPTAVAFRHPSLLGPARNARRGSEGVTKSLGGLGLLSWPSRVP